METLYENIAILRKAHKLTQEKLGTVMGYSKSMISKIENGDVDLTVSRVKAFANVFGVSPGTLMGWDSSYENLNAPLILEENPEYESFMSVVRGASPEELATAAKVLSAIKAGNK